MKYSTNILTIFLCFFIFSLSAQNIKWYKSLDEKTKKPKQIIGRSVFHVDDENFYLKRVYANNISYISVDKQNLETNEVKWESLKEVSKGAFHAIPFQNQSLFFKRNFPNGRKEAFDLVYRIQEDSEDISVKTYPKRKLLDYKVLNHFSISPNGEYLLYAEPYYKQKMTYITIFDKEMNIKYSKEVYHDMIDNSIFKYDYESISIDDNANVYILLNSKYKDSDNKKRWKPYVTIIKSNSDQVKHIPLEIKNYVIEEYHLNIKNEKIYLAGIVYPKEEKYKLSNSSLVSARLDTENSKWIYSIDNTFNDIALNEFELKLKSKGILKVEYDIKFSLSSSTIKENGDIIFNLLIKKEKTVTNPDNISGTAFIALGRFILCYSQNNSTPKYAYYLNNNEWVNGILKGKTITRESTKPILCTSENNLNIYLLTKNEKTKKKEYKWINLDDNGNILQEKTKLAPDNRYIYSFYFNSFPEHFPPFQFEEGKLLVCIGNTDKDLIKTQICIIDFN